MSAARHAGSAHVSLGGSVVYARDEAAVRTLERLGYTHKGGREWAPPLGARASWYAWLSDTRESARGAKS